MEVILEQDVPPIVKCSPYLQALLSNEPFPEAGIEIPTGCAKKNTHVSNGSEMKELLQTLRFWMVPEVLETCKGFLHFAFDPLNEEVLKECATEYELTIPSLLHVQAVVFTSKSEVERLNKAISMGCVFLLEFMCEELHYPKPVGVEFLNLAANSGQVTSLCYLHENGGIWDDTTLYQAVEGKCLECVKYLVDERCPGLTKRNCADFLDLASSEGNLPMVKFLWDVSGTKRGRYCKTFIAENAARYGHVSMMEFARKQNSRLFSTPLSSVSLMIEAVCGRQLHCLEYLFGIGQVANEQVMASAVQVGSLQCMQLLLEMNCPIGNNPRLGELVMHSGDWEFAKEAFELGVPWNERTMAAAAGRGLLEAMQWLLARGCPWNETTCTSAAQGGHFNCLQYAHENGCPWDVKTCGIAAQQGHLDCLQYAHENGCAWQEISVGTPQGEKCISARAALAITVDCLKYVVDNGARLEFLTSTYAAIRGMVPVMEYLLSVGCPCNAHTCAVTVRGADMTTIGQLSFYIFRPSRSQVKGDPLGCLRLLHANGCTWDADTCRGAIESRNMACFQYAVENGGPWDTSVCSAAARMGSLEGVRFAREHGCPWDADTCRDAAVSGSLECLRYVHENHCPWAAGTCSAAAGKGSLECLRFAHENGCPWDEHTCSAAARAGSMECLRFAHENGCPWDVETSAGAAGCVQEEVSLAMLQYVHGHGCPWNERACSTAAMVGYGDCLVYLHENGCPWDEKTCQYAGTRECYEYAVANGCPGAELSHFIDPLFDVAGLV